MHRSILAGTGLALFCPCAAIAQDEPLVAWPRPLITEILYAVPMGPEGDASGDGSRHANGDEFVELINPHDRPIQLKGFTLTDRNSPKRGQFKFTFPEFELAPSQVVVVFNGNGQAFRGPVGDSNRAPDGPNGYLHDAWIFSAGVTSRQVAFSNGGDWVLLADPRNRPVQLIHWGTFQEQMPPGRYLIEEAPRTTTGSVQRRDASSALVKHDSIDGLPLSPGRFEPPEQDQQEPAASPSG